MENSNLNLKSNSFPTSDNYSITKQQDNLFICLTSISDISHITHPCSDEVTELCKLQTEKRLTVAELNEKCEAMMNQVDITAEAQVMMAYFGLSNIIWDIIITISKR